MNIKIATASLLGILLCTGSAFAQQPSPPVKAAVHAAPETMAIAPAGSITVTDWYRQNVYDASNVKIGDVSDVLVSPVDGKITAIIVGVGGFLGLGEKDVAVPFDAVKWTMVDKKSHLTMTTTKDALMKARAFKFDRTKSTWSEAELVK